MIWPFISGLVAGALASTTSVLAVVLVQGCKARAIASDHAEFTQAYNRLKEQAHRR